MRILATLGFVVAFSTVGFTQPECVDQRLSIELFAAAPDIVQPVSATFDQNGRLLVIENHTHFRPDDYEGPETDRIRMIRDADGDGRADTFKTWFEGRTRFNGPRSTSGRFDLSRDSSQKFFALRTGTALPVIHS